MNVFSLLEHLQKTQWQKKEIPHLKGPILSRYDLQNMNPPKGDFVAKTSGSTGIPVEIQKTNLSKFWWNATNLLEAFWHKRDFSESFAVIRPFIKEKQRFEQWGPAFSHFKKTGPLFTHPVEGDINSWLQEVQPGYLMAFPSIIDSLDLSSLKNLKGIKTTGETLINPHPLIADTYSSEEVGTIALQCPDNPNVYHVMDNIILEILDENNLPSDIGRVVVTDLTSRYLYRYDIGDYAQKGQCHCGRGLQTIQKILGRRRNRVILPDGSFHWPRLGSLEYRKIAPIRRFQVLQLDKYRLMLKLSVKEELDSFQKDQIISLLQTAIGYPFDVEIEHVQNFPAGKFEEFINLYDQNCQQTTGHLSASS